MRDLNRSAERHLLPVTSYQTFEINAPAATHFRKGTCVEAECPHYLNGWRTRVEGLPPEMLHAAKTSGRRFREEHIAEGETWLVFEAGQPCFRASQHRVRIERPELYIARAGDSRGNPNGQVTRHTRPEHWVEQFAENQDNLATVQQRG
ncbi:hypothetical protein ACH492_22130 [Streptomyces sp. NPDC019443]|uniref:hypothetical protein n=1 Tax=Streptomyces sp. NPDC019443 TaxID=3365061 RepID=UPI0037B95D51